MKRFLPIRDVLRLSFIYLVLFPLLLYSSSIVTSSKLIISGKYSTFFYKYAIFSYIPIPSYAYLLIGFAIGLVFEIIVLARNNIWSITIGTETLTYMSHPKKKLKGQAKGELEGDEFNWTIPLSSIQDVIFKDKGEMLEGWYVFKDVEKIIVMLDQNTYKIMIVTAYSRGQIEKIMSLLKSRITSQS